MALKLKTVTIDGQEYAVLKEGKPLYTDDIDNKELAFDAEQTRVTAATLNREAAEHRTALKKLQESLQQYNGANPEEVAAFRATLEEMGGLEGIKKLKEKSGIDVEAIKKSITEAYEGKLTQVNKAVEEKDGTIRQLLVSNGISTAESLKGTIFESTRDVAESYFGKHFKVENGKPVAYLGDNAVLSRKNPGELAGVDEALDILIDQHPQRDSFRLGTGGGSGAGGSGTGGSFGGIKTRADFKSDTDKSKFISENGLEAFKALPAQ